MCEADRKTILLLLHGWLGYDKAGRVAIRQKLDHLSGFGTFEKKQSTFGGSEAPFVINFFLTFSSFLTDHIRGKMHNVPPFLHDEPVEQWKNVILGQPVYFVSFRKKMQNMLDDKDQIRVGYMNTLYETPSRND